MSNPWFRMYHEFATDPKVQMLSEADQRRFIMLLCLRCSNDDVTLHDEEVAFQLRISADEYAQTKQRLMAKNLINADNTPVAWEKRQFASDSSAERVRKHRERKKQEQEQACNVTETKSNALDTDTDTDKHSTSAREENSPPVHEDQPTPTRKGLLCKRLREIGIEASPHKLDEADWVKILAMRTDEEIIAFAETVMRRKRGQRVAIGYLAPGLLESPERVPPERGNTRGPSSRPLSAPERVRAANPLPGDFPPNNGHVIDIGGNTP